MAGSHTGLRHRRVEHGRSSNQLEHTGIRAGYNYTTENQVYNAATPPQLTQAFTVADLNRLFVLFLYEHTKPCGCTVFTVYFRMTHRQFCFMTCFIRINGVSLYMVSQSCQYKCATKMVTIILLNVDVIIFTFICWPGWTSYQGQNDEFLQYLLNYHKMRETSAVNFYVILKEQLNIEFSKIQLHASILRMR